MPPATTQRECLTCHQPFTVELRRTKDPRRGLYCSRSCASVYGGTRSKILHPSTGILNPNYRHGDSRHASRYTRPYKRAHPERVAAHKAVQRALETGVLVKPDACQRCAQPRRLDAHHEDYAEPLVVLWLCRRCHRAVHVAARLAAA